MRVEDRALWNEMVAEALHYADVIEKAGEMLHVRRPADGGAVLGVEDD